MKDLGSGKAGAVSANRVRFTSLPLPFCLSPGDLAHGYWHWVLRVLLSGELWGSTFSRLFSWTSYLGQPIPNSVSSNWYCIIIANSCLGQCI